VEISTKYSIGDEVWIVAKYFDKEEYFVCRMEIDFITVEVDDKKEISEKYFLICKYRRLNNKYYHRNIKNIFDTKEEALKSMEEIK